MTKQNTDRIEKNVILRAPRSRVWGAISDSQQFGTWFALEMEGPFVAGARVTGTITSPGKYEGLTALFVVENVTPETFFSFRWHPYAVDPKVDYSKEPMTLVSFTLSDDKDGTHLRIVESGFDSIPEARRAEAFRMNDEGWGIQAQNIARYVGATL